MLLGGINEVASGFVIAGGAVGGVGALAVLIAYLRQGSRAETVRLQREEIDAQKQRMDTMSEEKRELARLLAEESTKVRKLEAQVSLLTELVTKTAQVEVLRQEHTQHHQDVMAALSGINATLAAVAAGPTLVALPGTTAVVGGKRASDPPAD